MNHGTKANELINALCRVKGMAMALQHDVEFGHSDDIRTSRLLAEMMSSIDAAIEKADRERESVS